MKTKNVESLDARTSGTQVNRFSESEELLGLVIDSVKDYAIFTLDPNGYILSWNQGARNIKGYTVNEILGKHISVFYTAEEIKNNEPERNLTMAMKNGRFEDEGWRVRKDGTTFWANVIFTPLYSPGGELRGFAKVTRDITEKKKAAEELKHVADRLLLATQTANIGVWDLDLVAQTIFWDDAMYALYGFDSSTDISVDKAWQTGIYPADSAKVAEDVRVAIEGKAVMESEFRIIWPDGTIRNIKGRAVVQCDESGNAVRMLGTNWDITAQKQAEKQLRETEERLQLTLDAMSAGLWEWKIAEGNKRWWSPRYYEMLGYKNQEIEATVESLRAMFHPDDVAFAFKNQEDHLLTSDGFSFETRYRTKSGEFKWYHVSGKTEFDNTGNPLRMVGSMIDIDQRKKNEEIIAQQAALIQILPDAILYGEKDGSLITNMNEVAEQMFGVSVAKARGKRLDDIAHINIVSDTREHLREELWGEGGYWRGEAIFTMLNGKKLNILVTLKKTRDIAGNDGWIAIYTDITALKLMEERLQLALEGMVAGLWDWRIADGNKGWWSPKVYDLLGYENNEVEHSFENFRKLIHEADAKMAFDTLKKHFNNPDRFEIDARFMTKTGEYRWFQVTGKPIFDESGKAYRMVGSIIDIDGKKNADLMVRQQAALIQMMPDGIIYGDMNRRIISLNRGAEKMLEISSTEAKGQCYDDLITTNVINNGPRANWERFLKTGFLREELELTNHTGKKYTVLLSMRLLENLPGTDPGWVATYTDISPLRLNRELKDALKKVETSNEYLEQLAYISAHDIKSPIITLEGLINLMTNANAVKPEYNEVLNMLSGTIGQMKRTNHALNHILKLRKNLLHKGDVDDQVMELGTIMKDVKATLRTNLKEVGANVSIELNGLEEERFPYVHLKSIFFNLLNNSVKYHNPNRKLQINITAVKVTDSLFSFVVIDNGLGIDLKKNKDKLFGIFKRFHDHVEGSGVGLHIVKSIIDAYGGEIMVESTPATGTCFRFTFNNAIIA